MHDALLTAEKFLRDAGYVYAANQAAIAAEAFLHDPQKAFRMLNTAEWWGDKESVAAIDLAIDGGFSPQARRDAATLREALIEIFSTMLAYDEHNETGEIIVSQFRKWRESHV